MRIRMQASAAGFNADKADSSIVQERVKNADRIAAAANARYDSIRQPTFFGHDLFAHLITDNPLKISDHHRIRMRASSRSEEEERIFNVSDPITKRFVSGVLQRPG